MGSHDDITAAPHDADKSNASTAGSLPFYGGGDKGVNALTQLQEVTVRGEDADVALAQMGYTPQLKRVRLHWAVIIVRADKSEQKSVDDSMSFTDS